MGYDLYVINVELFYLFLVLSNKYNIKLYHVIKKEDAVYFYVPIYQRYLLKKIDLDFTRIRSVGFLSYLLFIFFNKNTFIFVLSFFVSFLFYTSVIYDVRVVGLNPTLNIEIEEYLKDYHIDRMKYKKSFENLNDILLYVKDRFKDKIEYLNLYQRGGVFFVEYTSLKKQIIKEEKYKNLYAASDGLIAFIDADSGVVKVKVNDYVKKGDLLVENYVLSTSEQMSIIPVQAKIYAYTFHQYSATKKGKDVNDIELFYELLLSIRSNIMAGSKIDVEKVLQIERSHSTITLKMHYTLIEDIAIEGD